MPLDFRKEALRHINRLEAYAKRIEQAYEKANKELARIAASTGHDPDELFRLSDYPEVRARVDEVIKNLHDSIEVAILNGEKIEWGYANGVNNALAEVATGLTAQQAAKSANYKRYFNQNAPALSAFQKRKESGLNLSQRVWNLTDQYKRDMELGLSIGISDGRSDGQLSRDLRSYLNEPDKLFRRVRDEYGNLVLSKNAKAYHPGQGVYRSSYKNAMRLTRTEINMAYRAADQARWKQMDFVLGYKIARSNNPYSCPVCESLQGNYPKDFVFHGWHPQCMCVITPILQEMDAFLEEEDALLNGGEPVETRKGTITDVPDNFKKWVGENQERIEKAKKRGTEPYWVKENKDVIDKIMGSAHPKSAYDLNIEEVAKKLGVSVGEKMTFKEANELRGNPLYATGREEYSVNCQCSVVANELRRRGFDVQAQPNYRKAGSITSQLSTRTEWAWIDPQTGKQPQSKTAGGFYFSNDGRLKNKSMTIMNSELDDLTKDAGRYHIKMVWKGTRSGHIVTAERLADGSLRLYDPQTGQVIDWFKNWSRRVKLDYGAKILRVDGMEINAEIIEGVVLKSK